MKITRDKLEEIYAKYNRREYLFSDPVQFLYQYHDVRDREIVGLIASSFSYGNVPQILKTIRFILQTMGDSPHDFVLQATMASLSEKFKDFKHRWHTGKDLSLMLTGIQNVIRKYGSLGECFSKMFAPDQEQVTSALSAFIKAISENTNGMKKNLLPLPERSSACKRLHLYLRWMVRRDEVDPGGWHHINPSKLLIPLDTHMFRFCRQHRFTHRLQANGKAVEEITKAFRKINPEDPARYDFAITRMGILKEKFI